ncbi:hypothetical protein EDC01DRAFT_646757 [Geopyxis carbonaria]|nr:hypothetical protein EDC01DRAFT_646757 [Geopyxis carbonaria]
MHSPPPSQPGSRQSLSPTQQTSPPNHHASHHYIPAPFRPLQAPKSPLYRPAVLRAIEGPLRSHNATSPKLASDDFIGDFKREGDIIRHCADDFDDSEIDYIQEGEESGKVTGPPQRAHWKPDSEAPVCDAPTCTKSFSFYIRRHHCRR